MSLALFFSGAAKSLNRIVLRNQQAKLSSSLAFVNPYGHTPRQRALNGYLQIHDAHVIENTVLAGTSAVKSGQLQLKKSNLGEFFTTFDSLEDKDNAGHTYHVTANLPLKPGQAVKLIDNPRAMMYLMSCFPTGATFIKMSTVYDLVNLRPDDRITYMIKNFTRMQKEHKEALETDSFLTGYGVVLGNIDIVVIRGHRISTHVGGLKQQCWEAGTSGAHGLCGKLTWRLIFDPANPNNLTVQWYGEGQSYAQVVDDANNSFVSLGFPIIAELFQFGVNNDYLDKTYDTFKDLVRKGNPNLANRTWVVKQMMPQRLAEMLNDFWRKPGQFNAADIEAKLKAESKAKAVMIPLDRFDKVLESKDSLPKFVEDLPPMDKSAYPGLYFNGELVDGRAPQALFVPDEEITPVPREKSKL